MLDTADYEARAKALVDAVFSKASLKEMDVDVAAWVEAEFHVPDGVHAGRLYDFTETPFWREPMECLSLDHPCVSVTIKKSIQVGYSTLAQGWKGAHLHLGRGLMMFVMPTINTAREYSTNKFGAAIKYTPALLKAVRSMSQKSGEGSTLLKKITDNAALMMTGANSAPDLQSHTIQKMICDEINQFPLDLEGQGDPMEMIDGRQQAFHKSGRYKKLQGGNCTVTRICRVEESFKAGDQRYYLVPCPHCGTKQRLQWEQLEFNETYPYNAVYICSENKCQIEEHHKRSMLLKGGWVASELGAGRQPSFAINALYSNFTTWDKMVEVYLRSKDDPLKLKSWTNRWKGEPFEIQGDVPDHEEIKKRADALALYQIGEVPDEVLFLTAGADVQKDRIEIVIIGWAIGGTSYVIDYQVLYGDTEKLAVWGECTEYWQRERLTKSGVSCFIEMMAVDAGYRSQTVYSWVRGKEEAPKGMPKAIAIKGSSRRSDRVLSQGKVVDFDLEKAAGKKKSGRGRKGRVHLYQVDGWSTKISFYGRLAMEGPDEAGRFPVGYCHHPAGLSENYYQQATSEVLVQVDKRGGRPDYQWQLIGNVRNEVLDCCCYAYAAAHRLGMHKFTPLDWENLARERTAFAPEQQDQLDMLSGALTGTPTPTTAVSAEERGKLLAARLNGKKNAH